MRLSGCGESTWKGVRAVRRLWILAVLLLTLALLAGTVFADETVVSELKTDCTVEKDGACTITMDLTIDLADGTESFSIPISSVATNLSCVGATYRLVGGTGCKLLRLTGISPGKLTLTVSYRLTETVTDNGKAQEFLVNLLYPYWDCRILRYEVTVRLPGKFESMPVFLSGYYGDLIDNYMEIGINDGVIHAVLNPKQTLQDHEAMSMRLELPEGFFDLRFLAGKTVRTDRMLFFALLFLAALYWLAFLRNLPLLPKRQAMPPEGGNPGEIPYVLTNRDPDLAMMVVQWASLGYLTISRSRKGRIWLSRQIDMDNERKSYEGEVFRTLFSRGDHCDVRSAEYLKARRIATERGKAFWRSRVYDPKGGPTAVLRVLALGAGLALCLACFDLWVASKSWRWLVILPLTLLGTAGCWAIQQLGGFLLRRHWLRTAALAALAGIFLLVSARSSGLLGLMVLNLAAQWLVGMLLRCGGRRTAAGAALGAELLGYRRYLLGASSGQTHANLAADPQFFYRILPFADALQVGRLFSSSFDRTRLEPCDWLHWEGKELHTALAFYVRYRRLLAGLRGERDPGAPRRVKSRQPPVSTRMEMPVSRRRTDAAQPRRTSARQTHDRRGGRP